jgi:ribosomal protein S18 acetylase RimI-like enzyme
MSDIVIREAVPQDAPGIARVHVITWRDAYRNHLPSDFLAGLSIEKRTEVWRRLLEEQAGQRTVFVAEIDHTIIGFSMIGKSLDSDADEYTGELYALYIDPAYKRQGLGSMLLHIALEELRNRGYTNVTLWVPSKNIGARTFYERRGWFEDGSVKIDTSDRLDLHETRYRIIF